MPIDSTGPISGSVSSSEAFTVDAAVSEILTDRPALLADNADAFERRAREVLTQTRPGHTAGFADVVMRVAWRKRREQVGRLALSAPALARIEQLIARLPDSDTTWELRAEVIGATQRLSWTGAAPTDRDTDLVWEAAPDGAPGTEYAHSTRYMTPLSAHYSVRAVPVDAPPEEQDHELTLVLTYDGGVTHRVKLDKYVNPDLARTGAQKCERRRHETSPVSTGDV